ncbi:MAG: hypothetical protein AABY18_08565 [Candidatus Thermoplasmatota archaeon]
MTPAQSLLVALLVIGLSVGAFLLLVSSRGEIPCASCGKQFDRFDRHSYGVCQHCGHPWQLKV